MNRPVPAPPGSQPPPRMPAPPPAGPNGGHRPSGSSSGSGRGNGRGRVLRVVSLAAGLVFVVGLVSVISSGGSDKSPAAEPSETISPTTVKSSAQGSEIISSPVGENWEDVARSVVYIEATGSDCGWRGSGSIVGDGSLVLTNQHVAGDGECDLAVYLTDSTSATPTQSVRAEVVVSDSTVDLAIIQLFDSSGAPYVATGRTPLSLSAAVPKLGDKITILGYPGLGGSTITLTSGDFSGIDRSESYEYLKTTANMNPGVSGGSAFNSAKQLVGVPTAGRGAEIACDGNTDCVANGSTIGLLRPVSLAQQILTRANTKLGK